MSAGVYLKILFPVFLALNWFTVASFASDQLPGGSLKLSKVLSAVESKGIRPSKVSIQDRQWVVEGITQKESVRVHVEPRTGVIKQREVIKDLDPIESKLSMSKVVRKIEQANPGPIFRVHFAKKRWIIETRRGKQATEMQLSADTGDLVMGRDE